MDKLRNYLRDIIEDPTTHHRKEVAYKCIVMLDEAEHQMKRGLEGKHYAELQKEHRRLIAENAELKAFKNKSEPIISEVLCMLGDWCEEHEAYGDRQGQPDDQDITRAEQLLKTVFNKEEAEK